MNCKLSSGSRFQYSQIERSKCEGPREKQCEFNQPSKVDFNNQTINQKKYKKKL